MSKTEKKMNIFSDSALKKQFADNGCFDNQASREQWQRRMCSLAESEQKKIAKKYYGGKMPWKYGNAQKGGAGSD